MKRAIIIKYYLVIIPWITSVILTLSGTGTMGWGLAPNISMILFVMACWQGCQRIKVLFLLLVHFTVHSVWVITWTGPGPHYFSLCPGLVSDLCLPRLSPTDWCPAAGAIAEPSTGVAVESKWLRLLKFPAAWIRVKADCLASCVSDYTYLDHQIIIIQAPVLVISRLTPLPPGPAEDLAGPRPCPAFSPAQRWPEIIMCSMLWELGAQT